MLKNLSTKDTKKHEEDHEEGIVAPFVGHGFFDTITMRKRALLAINKRGSLSVFLRMLFLTKRKGMPD